MEKRQGSVRMLLLLYGMLIGALLILAVAGARCYAGALEKREAHTAQRSALSFIQSQVAACAGKDQVTLRQGPQGQALCLKESDSGYETRIYCYDGGLYSEFSRVDSELRPEAGERICDLRELEFSWETERLLKITAQGRTAYVCCDGGGGHA